MSSTPHEPSSRENRVNEAIAAYLQAVERGENPDREKFLAEHAAIEQELKSFFANQAEFQQAAGERMESSSEPTVTYREGNVPAQGQVIRYFGDYELLEEIDRGGMGVVFKARQSKLNRVVAVKMILAGSLARPEDVQRFHIEAEAAAKLDHPGIVPIFEIGEHEGQHYFSMGFVEGRSLAKRVAEGPLPPREAADIVRTVAEAVQFAHTLGVIHRDLKPGNILMDRELRPKVTDFGLAKLVAGSLELTASDQILGTPPYMSPEQACPALGEIGPATDIYALGAVLYCLLTGRPPFQAASHVETLRQVLEQEPVPPRRLNSNVPVDLETIALKCLSKPVRRRYVSAAELASDLAAWLNGEPICARPAGAIRRLSVWIRRHRTLMSATATSVPAVGLTAFLLIRLPETASNIVLVGISISLAMGFWILLAVLLYAAFKSSSTGTIKARRQLEVVLEDIEMTSVRLISQTQIPTAARAVFCNEAIDLYERCGSRREMPGEIALVANLAAARLREIGESRLGIHREPTVDSNSTTPASIPSPNDLVRLTHRNFVARAPQARMIGVDIIRALILGAGMVFAIAAILLVSSIASLYDTKTTGVVLLMLALGGISLSTVIARDLAQEWYVRRRMKNPDATTRRKAIEYSHTRGMKSRRTVRALTERLHDLDETVRLAAVHALTSVGAGASGAQAELAALSEHSQNHEAAEAIRARQFIEIASTQRAREIRLFLPNTLRGTVIGAVIAFSVGRFAPLTAAMPWSAFIALAAGASIGIGLVSSIAAAYPPRLRPSQAMFGLSIRGTQLFMGAILTASGWLAVLNSHAAIGWRFWMLLAVGMFLLLDNLIPKQRLPAAAKPDDVPEPKDRPEGST